MTAALERLAEVIAQREQRWSWENIDPEIQELYTERLADRLPDAEPEATWEAMEIKHRREWLWSVTRTAAEHRAVWQEEEHRLRLLADEATVEAFKALTEIQRSAS